MIFGMHEPCKFAFSQEDSDFDNIPNDDNLWGIIGVPFDSTVSYHVGSRYGPLVVREASYSFEYYNTILNKELDTVFYDFGDLNAIPGNCKKTCDLLEDVVSDLLSNNIRPILIGGEHSATKGSLSAIANNQESNDLSGITIIHIDAHRDIIDDYQGEKDSHATVIHRVFDLNPEEIVQIGIRSSSLEEEEFVSEHDNITTFKADDLRKSFSYLLNYLESINTPIYISIDMDALDPAYAPSLGNPVPCGLSPEDIQEILLCLKDKDILGFDIMEVAADRLGDITAINAAKIIYDFLSLR
ncbi:agmatinase [Methanobrevibacter sp. 87.7]|uniref:agmatinase n=1 Tax=Methanobrevibacter sp. 87.7 TaxID=387957 RepID=UPI000B50822D|nr:agmatinase [Methanobrevibacter sp. 87.7]OWT33325.1 agmatinase [Methanobrevibacter sp. 87.7]